MKVCCVFSVESPHRGDSNEYTQYTTFEITTQYTTFEITKEITLNYPKSAALDFFPRDSRASSKSGGTPAISVRFTEGLLYMAISNVLLSFLSVVFVYSFSCNWCE